MEEPRPIRLRRVLLRMPLLTTTLLMLPDLFNTRLATLHRSKRPPPSPLSSPIGILTLPSVIPRMTVFRHHSPPSNTTSSRGDLETMPGCGIPGKTSYQGLELNAGLEAAASTSDRRQSPGRHVRTRLLLCIFLSLPTFLSYPAEGDYHWQYQSTDVSFLCAELTAPGMGWIS